MIHRYPALFQVLAASNLLKLPPKLKKEVKPEGDFSNISKWKVKIQIGNSMRGDAVERKGDFDGIGYVWVNAQKKLFVPIARSDEHHMGGDLMHDYLDQGVISGSLQKEWVPIYALGHTYIFKAEDKDRYLQAFTVWRENGGPNIQVESYTSGGEDYNYLGSMDDFIQRKGLMKRSKGELAGLGKALIQKLEGGAKALALTLKTGKGEQKVFYFAHQILDSLDNFTGFRLLPENSKKMKEKLAQAEAKNDLQAASELIWGFNGVKNHIHNKLREAVLKFKEDPTDYGVKDLLKYFGDIDLALQEFNRLGDI